MLKCWVVTEDREPLEGGWLCLNRDPHSSPCLLPGTYGLGELVTDTLYLRSCQAYGAVPASCFLHQGRAPELNLRYRGLGPQVPLEEPWGRAGRERNWEEAAMGVAFLLSPSCTLPGLALCQAYPTPTSG